MPYSTPPISHGSPWRGAFFAILRQQPVALVVRHELGEQRKEDRFLVAQMHPQMVVERREGGGERRQGRVAADGCRGALNASFMASIKGSIS